MHLTLQSIWGGGGGGGGGGGNENLAIFEFRGEFSLILIN